MDDKRAAKILMGLLDKYSLEGDEKDAVDSAIGLLSWVSLSQSRIKARKKALEKKFDKSTGWQKAS
jgi:hypothetical protein